MHQAVILVFTGPESKGKESTICDAIKALTFKGVEVEKCLTILGGKASFWTLCTLDDPESFGQFVTEGIQQIEGVIKTSTRFVK